MTETKMGRVVHEARGGYVIVEALEVGPQGEALTGFALVGPLASSSIIYVNRQEALEALHDIEDRASGR